MSKMHVVADMEINRFLRAFDTRDEAVEFVSRLLKSNGEEYVYELAIGRQTVQNRFVDSVTGDDLLVLVRDRATSRSRTDAAAASSSGGRSSGGGSHDSGEASSGFGALAAKSYE